MIMMVRKINCLPEVMLVVSNWVYVTTPTSKPTNWNFLKIGS